MSSLFHFSDTAGPHYTLTELNGLVSGVIERHLDDAYWLLAEIAECHENRGHCYMDLVEKDDGTRTPKARAQAKCWHATWVRVASRFQSVTGRRPEAGMKLLMRVKPEFHVAYGFSWTVLDIDADYTLGDLARRRREIVEQLRSEGVFDLQRELHLPLFCQRIAVISAAGAAGYGDFCRHLADNAQGLAFFPTLFPAVMQGEQVEQTVVSALTAIYNVQERFDCVVIIRGGGATSDLSGFDTLALAESVAQFPLPVITGIGHERDESVLDMVSHQRVKTPTAAADLLIAHLSETAGQLVAARDRMEHVVADHLYAQRQRLAALRARIPTAALTAVGRQQVRVRQAEQRLTLLPAALLQQHRHRLQLLAQRAEALDPALLLRRGYTLTLFQGRPVTDPAQIIPGDVVETRTAKGNFKSKVI